MRFILFLILLAFYSCKQEDKKKESLIPLPDQTRVIFKEKDKQLEKTANALGYLYVGSYEIYLNTLASYGKFYTAVVTVNPDNSGEDLVCYDFFHSINLRGHLDQPKDSATYYTTKFEFDLVFNPGISTYLNQDNCYFSISGLWADFNHKILETCTPGKMNRSTSYRLFKPGEFIKSDNIPIKLLGRDFQIPILNKEGKKTYKKGRLELGFLTYDHKKEPDFDALFNSRNFIVNINAAWALANGRNGYPTGTRFNEEELKISNFYTK